MLLLEDKRFYIYVYLNPLKLGNFNYSNKNLKIFFRYSPFYIGYGIENRLYDHLKEINNKNIYNPHKINTIKKIFNNNLKPIIYKLQENLNETQAKKIEIEYIKLIGRRDKKTGFLTNLTDGGERTSNLSEKIMKKRNKKIRKTLENNPEILKEKGKKISKTKNNKSIEEKEKIGKKISESKKGNTWENMYGKEKADKMRKEAKERNSGEKAPFYGRKHTTQSKQLIGFKSKTIKKNRKKGNPNKGKTYEEIYGEKRAKEEKKKRGNSNKGKRMPKEHMGFLKKLNTGKKLSQEQKEKIRKSLTGKIRKEVDIQLIFNLRNQGLSYKSIGNIFKVSKTLIKNRLNNFYINKLEK